MIPADADDMHEEYRILLNELSNYNPELLDKRRLLAISKSDMLDEELMEALSEDLPEIPHIFISSVTGYNITQLKDLLWKELNADGEYQKSFEISHRNLDIKKLGFEESEEEDVPEDDYEEEWDEDENEEFDPEFYYEEGEEFEDKE